MGEALGLLAPKRQPDSLTRLVYDLNVPLGELVRQLMFVPLNRTHKLTGFWVALDVTEERSWTSRTTPMMSAWISLQRSKYPGSSEKAQHTAHIVLVQVRQLIYPLKVVFYLRDRRIVTLQVSSKSSHDLEWWGQREDRGTYRLNSRLPLKRNLVLIVDIVELLLCNVDPGT